MKSSCVKYAAYSKFWPYMRCRRLWMPNPGQRCSEMPKLDQTTRGKLFIGEVGLQWKYWPDEMVNTWILWTIAENQSDTLCPGSNVPHTYVLNKGYTILVYTILHGKQNQRVHLSHSCPAFTATNNLQNSATNHEQLYMYAYHFIKQKTQP